MRRLTAGSALAAAVAAGFVGTRAFLAPAQSRPEKAARKSRLDHVSFGSRVCARSSSTPRTLFLLFQSGQQRQQQEERRQGGRKEDHEAYAGQDDQRRFWDTVVKVRSYIFHCSKVKVYHDVPGTHRCKPVGAAVTPQVAVAVLRCCGDRRVCHHTSYTMYMM